jgi:hypothetical protein
MWLLPARNVIIKKSNFFPWNGKNIKKEVVNNQV